MAAQPHIPLMCDVHFSSPGFHSAVRNSHQGFSSLGERQRGRGECREALFEMA